MADPAQQKARPPERLGRYRICEQLAQGGMATVYLACAEGPGGFEKLVALKTIHSHLAGDKGFVEMFLSEARIASQINHPNVCSVFDFGQHEGTYYLAMEYLLGTPLSRLCERVRRHPSPKLTGELPYYGARLIADAAEGLHAAHELRDAAGRPLNVVHRDVSPQNLFVTFAGSVKVVDFGVARAATSHNLTRPGSMKGKLPYIAPEMVDGFSADRRCDVWALGVCLWELLAQRHLFHRQTDAATLLAIIETEVLPPSRVLASVPHDLDAIVMRALQRDPDKRYATARELGRDLNQWLTRSGRTLDLGTVADWLAALLPDEKTAVLRRYEATAASVALSDAIHRSPTVPQIESQAGQGRRMYWVGLGAALAAVGLGAGAMFLATRPGTAPPPPAPVEMAPPGLDAALTTGTGLDAALAGARAPTPFATSQPATMPAADAALVQAEPALTPPQPLPDAVASHGPGARATTAKIVVDKAPVERGKGKKATVRRGDGPMGKLRVVMPEGWAEVAIDGTAAGRTPLTIELPVGTHTVTLKPNGEEPGSDQQVRVYKGAQVTVSVALQ